MSHMPSLPVTWPQDEQGYAVPVTTRRGLSQDSSGYAIPADAESRDYAEPMTPLGQPEHEPALAAAEYVEPVAAALAAPSEPRLGGGLLESADYAELGAESREYEPTPGAAQTEPETVPVPIYPLATHSALPDDRLGKSARLHKVQKRPPTKDLATLADDWFRPDMTKETVNLKLQQARRGDFFVRESSSQIGDYAISVQTGKNIWTGLVLKSDHGFQLSTSGNKGNCTFDELVDLISYYMTNAFIKDDLGNPLKLRMPMAQEHQQPVAHTAPEQHTQRRPHTGGTVLRAGASAPGHAATAEDLRSQSDPTSSAVTDSTSPPLPRRGRPMPLESNSISAVQAGGRQRPPRPKRPAPTATAAARPMTTRLRTKTAGATMGRWLRPDGTKVTKRRSRLARPDTIYDALNVADTDSDESGGEGESVP